MSSLHSSFSISAKSKTNTTTADPASSQSNISTMRTIRNRTNTIRKLKKSNKSNSGWCCFKVPKSQSPQIIHSISNTKFPFSKPFPNQKQARQILSPFSLPSTNVLSPTTTTSTVNNQMTYDAFSEPLNILAARGYIRKQKIADTLQGQVFVAESLRDTLLISGFIRQIIPDSYYNRTNLKVVCNICVTYFNTFESNQRVIKTANKELHSQGLTVTDSGRMIKVKEDIVKEAKLLQWFNAHNPPKTLITYYDFFEDNKDYYLVMEKGGKGLFDFTVQCHKLIMSGELKLKQWRKTVRYIFAKMVEFIAWLHNVMHCCNLDISLENIVMGNETYFDESSGTIKNLEIRFIDFGLSERFNPKNNKHFLCDKYVGKTGYKSPQVFHKKRVFRANKADIWSLGVCLFMLSIGAPPYKKPIVSDQRFEYLKCGQMAQLLTNWNRLHYIGQKQYDLINKILCIDENGRLSIGEIMNHSWMKPYFKSERYTQKRIPTLIISESNAFQCQNNYCCVVEK